MGRLARPTPRSLLAVALLALFGAGAQMASASRPTATSAAALAAAAAPNHVIIVSTSKYWFNYRHSTNALAVYAAGAFTNAQMHVRPKQRCDQWLGDTTFF